MLFRLFYALKTSKSLFFKKNVFISIFNSEKFSLRQQKLIENLVNLASIALQRLSAEEQLQKEHDNLDAILASSPVGMLVIDENQYITLANPAASRLFDKKPDEIRN